MNAGQNGAVGVVQHLSRHRTEDKPPERPVAVGRHHNKADALGVRVRDLPLTPERIVKAMG